MTYEALLFLDFDGVLHAAFGGAVGPAFCHAQMLADALAELPDVRIVITSTYRQQHGLPHLQTLLGSLGDRVVGRTPLLTGAQVRQREMQAWLERHPCDRFVVLDDTPGLFAKDWPPLVLCNPATGLDKHAVQLVIDRLTRRSAG